MTLLKFIIFNLVESRLLWAKKRNFDCWNKRFFFNQISLLHLFQKYDLVFPILSIYFFLRYLCSLKWKSLHVSTNTRNRHFWRSKESIFKYIYMNIKRILNSNDPSSPAYGFLLFILYLLLNVRTGSSRGFLFLMIRQGTLEIVSAWCRQYIVVFRMSVHL